ncbi:MAG: transporter substrate-binding domain-containing protein [Lachnospiraceae bacterium]|nr:transporter substrate-binding domain-containing protein [Lachnospiraceae bacterium]
MKIKNNIKKIIVTIAASALLLSALTGCGTSASAANPGPGSGDQLEKIKAAGKIVVGIEGTYPPFTYHEDDGAPAGIDVELAQKIAEKLGVEVEFVDGAWDSLLIGIDSGRFDTVINCVGITEERKQKYDFSDPYYFEAWQIVTRSDDDSIKSEEDLNGKKIATNITSAHATWYQEKGVEIVGIDTGDEAIEMLLTGRVDFIDCPVPVMNTYYDAHPDVKDKLKVAFVVQGGEIPKGIPVRKGEEKLLAEINKALSELRADGTLKELSEKYLYGDYSVSQEK